MAQGVRSRSLTTLLALVAGTLPALAGWAACTGEPGEAAAQPRAVDVATIADDHVVAAVLDECHRPLRGRMDRIAAEVRLAGGEIVRVLAHLPDLLRTAEPAGVFLLRGDAAWRLGQGDQTAVTPAERTRLQQLRAVVDASALGPVHRATACRRTGGGEFELTQPAGPPWFLRLRTGTLLPQALRGASGEVVLLDYLRTSTTWMVQQASLEGLGTCTLRFEQADLAWAGDPFAPPDVRAATKPDRPLLTMPASGGGEPRSPVPILLETRATRVVVVVDPGSWPLRVAAYTPLHAELERQDQQIAGFPMLWQEDGVGRLGAPFRQRAAGGQFAAPASWTVRELPAGRALVVYPPDGDLAERLLQGEQLLRADLAARGLQAAGAIVAQPFFHLHEGEPPAAKLAAPVVRMSVAVR